jgi:Mg-chelatase subunit ChlD
MSPSRIARTLLLSLGAMALMTGPALAGKKAPKPMVEVVFVIDTTGSMGGLIQGAKQKVWSIVNEIAKGKPSPDIRLGLIGYRDKTDNYVTTRTDLTKDLDAVYAKLMAFSANGGGDTPEHVNQGLWEAVHKMSWSKDRRALKVIFLVGDAPPHMDYTDDVKYQQTCQDAMHKDLIINTIQCGNDGTTRNIWQDIARKSEGRYVAIAQTGGTIAVATPYDSDLARLSADLDGTHVGYGSKSERKAVRAKMKKATVMAEAAPEAAAARASYRGVSGAMGSRDLLADDEAGTVAVEKLKEEELPDELKGKTAAQRKAYLNKKKAERAKIQKKITKLSQKRDTYVREQLAKTKKGGNSFDAQVIDSIRAKAEKKGIKY